MDAVIKMTTKAAGRTVKTYLQGECLVVVVEPGMRSGYRLLVSAEGREPTEDEIAAAMECIPRGIVMQLHESQVTDWIVHLEQIGGGALTPERVEVAMEVEQEGDPTLTGDGFWKGEMWGIEVNGEQRQ